MGMKVCLRRCAPCGLGSGCHKDSSDNEIGYDGRGDNVYTVSCTQCASGTYSDTVSSSGGCIPCEVGHESDVRGATTAATCTCCQVGWVAGEGSDICTICTAGKFANEEQSECVDCLKGHYNIHLAAVSNSSCLVCPVGKASLAGSKTCNVCDNGKYANSTGLEHCLNCGKGRFSTDFGAEVESVCIDCR